MALLVGGALMMVTLTNSGVVRASASATVLGNDILNTGRLDLGAQGLVSAGNDLISRGGTITGGDLTLAAGRDLTIEAVAVTTRTATAWDSRGNSGSQTTETTLHQGSLVSATGDVTLIAGRDLTVHGSTVEAGGALVGQAQTITITGAIDSHSVVSDTRTRSSGFLSSTTTTTHYEGTDQQVVASTLSGDTVSLRSTGDTTILGSNVVGTGDVTVVAGGDLTIGALAAHDHEAQSVRTRQSGLSFSGGGLFVGVASNHNESTLDSVTHTGSLVGSATGNTTLRADGTLTVSGSQVVSPGTTTLAGESIVIEHVTDTVDATSSSRSSSFGLSVGVQNPLVNGAQTAARMGEIAGGTDNARVAAVAGLAGGLAAYNAAEAVAGNPGALGGVNVSVSLGFSKSSSSGESHDETVVGSMVSGGNVNLIASGAGEASTIRITGSDVLASNDLLLAAEGAITAEAAAERDTFGGSSRSVGASVGVSFGIGTGQAGPTLNGSFSSSRGSYAGEEVSNREALLLAGGTATVTTPGALVLDGAQLAGERVEVDAGSLEIASRQDTSTYSSSHSSVGVEVSFNPATGAVSGSLNLGRGREEGEFASVAEQAGIYARSGGFDIAIDGHTSLTGAVIASEADAANNRLSTGTLEVNDLENREDWSASQTNFGLGLGANIGKDGDGNAAPEGLRDPSSSVAGVNVPGLGTVSATPPVSMGASGSQSSVTVSAIAPGVIEVTSGDAASLAAAGSVSRETDSANAPLVREFDEAQRQEIADGFEAGRALANEVDTFLTNRAAEADAKREEAEAREAYANDPNARDANGQLLSPLDRERLRQEADQLRYEADHGLWSMGGEGRQILTALTAAASGDVTGSLGGLVQGAAINFLQQNAAAIVGDLVHGKDGEPGVIAEGSPVHIALQGLIGCAGSAAGGGDCAAGAAGGGGAVLINELLFGDAADLTSEEREARSALLQAVIGGLGAAAGVEGSDLANAIASAENNELCIKGGSCWGPGAPTSAEEAEKKWDEFFASPDGEAALDIYGGNKVLIQACVTTGNPLCASTEAAYKQQAIDDLSGGDAEVAAALSGLSSWQIQDQIGNGTLTQDSAAQRHEVAAALDRMPDYMREQLNADILAMGEDDVNALTQLGASLFGDQLSPEQQLQYGLLAYSARATGIGLAEGAGTALSPIGQYLADQALTSPGVAATLAATPQGQAILTAAHERQQNRLDTLGPMLGDGASAAANVLADFALPPWIDPVTGLPLRTPSEAELTAFGEQQERAQGHLSGLADQVANLPNATAESMTPLVDCLMGSASPQQCGQAMAEAGVGLAVTVATDGAGRLVLSKLPDGPAMPEVDASDVEAPPSVSDFVLGDASEVRNINIRPNANDPNWGLTPDHLEKHLFGDGKYSLETIDPGGTADQWMHNLTDLFNAPVTSTTSNGMLDIVKEFPRVDGNGTYKMGIRISPKKPDGSYDLITILTRQ